MPTMLITSMLITLLMMIIMVDILRLSVMLSCPCSLVFSRRLSLSALLTCLFCCSYEYGYGFVASMKMHKGKDASTLVGRIRMHSDKNTDAEADADNSNIERVNGYVHGYMWFQEKAIAQFALSN